MPQRTWLSRAIRDSRATPETRDFRTLIVTGCTDVHRETRWADSPIRGSQRFSRSRLSTNARRSISPRVFVIANKY